MDSSESDVAQADAHILTFDIPDDALERAAAVADGEAVNKLPNPTVRKIKYGRKLSKLSRPSCRAGQK